MSQTSYRAPFGSNALPLADTTAGAIGTSEDVAHADHSHPFAATLVVTSDSRLSDTRRVKFVAAPASAGAAGAAGDVAYDTGFFYICVATNTWLKVAIATW